MTKKEFNSLCSHHCYTGWNGHKLKTNAIFFDHKSNGYKFMVKARIENHTKAELIKILYDWVFNDANPDWKTEYRFAETDENRFKVPLSISH
jgi:endonuclease I